MSLYYQDEYVALYHGRALDVVSEMEDESVDCIVTSPPYFGLRDYGTDGQYGAEETPQEFVDNLVALYREARRVLAADGTFWLNLGDSYSAKRSVAGIPPKSMVGIPWRVALALQDDGWILRNDIIWSKPNAMPESVRDRLATKYEHLFLFTKSPKYWFDLDPIREDQSPESIARRKRGDWRTKEGWSDAYSGNPPNGLARQSDSDTDVGRNPGDVWEIATRPFSGAHFAVFPQELPRRCIVAGCRPGGTVLDPCSGSGTTGAAATGNGRKYVGIDINADYLDLSLKTRLQQPVLDLGGIA